MQSETKFFLKQVSFSPLKTLLLSSLFFGILIFLPVSFVVLVSLSSSRSLTFINYLFIFWLISPYVIFFIHLYFYLKRKLSVIFWTLSTLYYFISKLILSILLIQNMDSFESIGIFLVISITFSLIGFLFSLYYLYFSIKFPRNNEATKFN